MSRRSEGKTFWMDWMERMGSDEEKRNQEEGMLQGPVVLAVFSQCSHLPIRSICSFGFLASSSPSGFCFLAKLHITPTCLYLCAFVIRTPFFKVEELEF